MTRAIPLLRRLLAPVIARSRSFRRDERGVTAIEFGILALPFFMLVFAIIETSMMFFAGQILDSAVEDASRAVRTGQAQTYTIDEFRGLVCEYTFGLFDCNQIRLKVDTLPDFTSTAIAPPVQNCTETTCTWTMVEEFDPGARKEVMQVFAYYRWPLLIVMPYFNLKNQPDNYRLLAATRVFRNEPF